MKQIILTATVIGLITVSCNKKEETNSVNSINDTTQITDSSSSSLNNVAESNAKTSLDWAGTYHGTLPCADCDGIHTIVTLNQDGTYKLSLDYLNKNNKIEENGVFSWSPDNDKVIIKAKDGSVFTYKVSENKIIQLDQEGNEILGSLQDKYILTKK